ncbi:MAG: UDP-N-acetylmuramate dehydrogenase [Acidimicrobiales bacterium]
MAAALARLGPLARAGAPLGALTTYRVGGLAAVGVTACAEEDLVEVATAVEESGLPVLVVGSGSNLLVSDAGFGGIAVLLDAQAFGEVEIGPRARVRAGAAVALPTLARRTAEAGLSGLEWAVGVPGSVGGGVRMNAGGHGSDVSRTISSCRLADLGNGPAAALPNEVEGPELALGYRRSAVGPETVVLDATFALRPGEREASLATIHDIVSWRRDHQPGGRNAGSVFTNPGGAPGEAGSPGEVPGVSAGTLIDGAGLKGHRVGSAEVSRRHANFIQADLGGSADDVYSLIQMIRQEVAARSGIVLEVEVRLVGFSKPLVEIHA